jgi:glycosyltransferase involved in cell wall biosynthesis
MRLGVVWFPCANAYYRAVDPIMAMARRGHEVVLPPDGDSTIDLERLSECDVVHVYRRCEEESRRQFAELVRRGTPITYDNDDDFSALPKQSPNYRELGGLEGQRGFTRTIKVARLARVFTTTNDVLAEKYRKAGIERVEVIGNHLALETSRPRVQHDGIVVGWVAGGEHQTDADLLPIAGVLKQLVTEHKDVRVECIGVNLALPERYRHDRSVDFSELPSRIGAFDIGIAPLVDIPLNRARSDIKLKEYAASGVPWLASPVGPYLGLGEEQGGRLVPDDRWLEALGRLVTDHRDRKRLARNAEAWARTETIEAGADRWERVFAEAAGSGIANVGTSGPAFELRSGARIRLRSRGSRER